MDELFSERIESWDDWGRVFQSVPTFSRLIGEIFRREGLPFSTPENLTPGTNAVFQVGETVVKIFFPRESGLDPVPDFENEAAVCGRLTALSIPTPPLLAKGKIDCKYRFYYLITRYFRGTEAGDWLRTAGPEEKREFAGKLRRILRDLNRPADGLIPPADLVGRAVENPRFRKLPPLLRKEMKKRAASMDLSQRVLVHGDLTGENILVDENGELIVIDCADACLAPAWYELGPVVFELFRCDPILLRAFAGEDWEGLVERALDALCIHSFGADLLAEAAKRERAPLFSSLEEVRRFLLGRMED